MTQPPPPTAAQLKAECHRLIDHLSRQPYSLKRLLVARSALKMAAGYKANRPPLPTSKGKTTDAD